MGKVQLRTLPKSSGQCIPALGGRHVVSPAFGDRCVLCGDVVVVPPPKSGLDGIDWGLVCAAFLLVLIGALILVLA